jgi:hypothetical protein
MSSASWLTEDGQLAYTSVRWQVDSTATALAPLLAHSAVKRPASSPRG